MTWVVALLLMLVPAVVHATTGGPIFRTACTQITAPVANQVLCYEETSPPTLKYWNGSVWVAMTGAAAGVTSLNGLVGIVSILGTAADISVTTLSPNITLDLINTAVTPGSYGSATQVATFTVDAKGRLTAAANVAITAGVTSIAGTANQITASAATGAVTLSIPAVWIAPGSVEVTTTLLTHALITAKLNAGTLPTAIGDEVFRADQVDGTITRILLDSFGAATNLTGRRANTSLAAPSRLLSADTILVLSGRGYFTGGSSGYSSASRVNFQFQAAENWTDVAQGTSIVAQTTPTGSTTAVTVLTIGADASLTSTGVVTGTRLVSTIATGTAPLTVASTTVVTNLNASLLLGGTWAIPGTIGSTTPNTGAFTTINASGTVTLTSPTTTALTFNPSSGTTSGFALSLGSAPSFILDNNLGASASVAGVQFSLGSPYVNTSNFADGFLVSVSFTPPSGSADFAGLEIRPTINGTSSGKASLIAGYSLTNTLTGGTIWLLDLGTTTTNFRSGNTQKFGVDVSGNVTVASLVGTGTRCVTTTAAGLLGATAASTPCGSVTASGTPLIHQIPIWSSATNLIGLAVGATTGMYLRNVAASDPVWSTLVLPNTAATGSILHASSTDTITALASVAADSYLRSAGTSSAPVWSTLILPNAGTTGTVLAVTSTNTVTATNALSLTGASPSVTVTRTSGTPAMSILGASALMTINAESPAPTPPGTPQLTMFGGAGADTTIVVDALGGIPFLATRRGNGTVATPTKLASGDTMFALTFSGWQGTTAAPTTYRAAMFVSAAEAWNDATHNGTKWILQATPLASATSTTVMTIGPSGVQIGAPTGGDPGADSLNVINYFSDGTAGVTATYTMCKTGACLTTCTIIAKKGIITGGTCNP